MVLKNKGVIVLGAALLLAVLITYSNHFHNSFHFDDSHTIENNIYIKNIKNIPLFFKDAGTFSSLPPNQTYRPIVSTSLAIDYKLAGGLSDTFYFHLSSFILFLFQGCLMYFLFKKLFKDETNSALLSVLCVAWYILHPASAETINYIIARSDLISTLFVVLAFVMYLYSSLSRKWHLYLLPVIVGSLAKISALMFAPLLFVYTLLIEQQTSILLPSKKTYQNFLTPIKASLPSFILCALIYFFLRSMDKETFVPGGTSFLSYLITQPYVIMHYFTTFFLPVNLSADTDLTVFSSIWNIKFFIGMSFISTLVSLTIFTSKNKQYRLISFGLCWFLITLIPTSSIIPFAEVMNDHRVFFPYVGLVISVVKSLQLLLNYFAKKKSFVINKIIVISCSILLLSVYAYGTYQRNKVWKTEESLWKDVTIKNPKNGRGHMNYGLTQMSQGNYTEALKEFSLTLKLLPSYAYAHINMGILKDAMGENEDAETYFQNAILYDPELPECHYYYARFLAKNKKTNLAITHLQQTLALSPAHINSRYLLMDIFLEEGRIDDLNNIAQKTLELLPDDKTTINYLELSKTKGLQLDALLDKTKANPTTQAYLDLSMAYYTKEDYIECINTCNKALALDPNNVDAYNNICSAYNQLKEWDKAIEACNHAIQINPNALLAKNNLAWAKTNKLIEKTK